MTSRPDEMLTTPWRVPLPAPFPPRCRDSSSSSPRCRDSWFNDVLTFDDDPLALFNELKKAEMLKESKETGKPILNVSNHIKKKPNQKTSATCNKSQVKPNRMMPKK